MSEALASAKPAKAPATPMFIIGADDRPTDMRTVAISLALRAEIKVGDREFSSPILAHEVVVLRHFYEVRAGSGTLRISASFPPGLRREKELTHSDLANEVKRMRETFITARQGGNIIKSFETFFGSEPTEQLKRVHVVMREQYAAWAALLAKAMGRLDTDTAELHPEVRRSMACDLITEREIEELVLLADPSRRGLGEIELDEVKLADIQKTVAPATTIEETRAAAEAAADAEVAPLSIGEKLSDSLAMNGIDIPKAMAIGALVEQYGADKVTDDDLVKVLGSKAKLEQTKRLIKG